MSLVPRPDRIPADELKAKLVNSISKKGLIPLGRRHGPSYLVFDEDGGLNGAVFVISRQNGELRHNHKVVAAALIRAGINCLEYSPRGGRALTLKDVDPDAKDDESDKLPF